MWIRGENYLGVREEEVYDTDNCTKLFTNRENFPNMWITYIGNGGFTNRRVHLRFQEFRGKT